MEEQEKKSYIFSDLLTLASEREGLEAREKLMRFRASVAGGLWSRLPL